MKSVVSVKRTYP